jgi:hypothetical protein
MEVIDLCKNLHELDTIYKYNPLITEVIVYG